MKKLLIDGLETLLGIKTLEQLCASIQDSTTENPFSQATRVLRLRHIISERSLSCIPASGPVLAVANHPTGGRDPIVLMDVLLRHRPDTRIISHPWFNRFKGFEKYTILMDPRDKSQEGMRLNMKGFRTALKHLKEGGLVLMFPSGAVSYYQPGNRRYEDPPWKTGLEWLIRCSKAPVLPVKLDGRNSKIYDLISRIHPPLRIALLAKELLWKQESTQRIEMQKTIPMEELEELASEDNWSLFLQRRVESMDSEL